MSTTSSTPPPPDDGDGDGNNDESVINNNSSNNNSSSSNSEHGNDHVDDNDDGHDEGSLKSYLNMDQIFLPQSQQQPQIATGAGSFSGTVGSTPSGVTASSRGRSTSRSHRHHHHSYSNASSLSDRSPTPPSSSSAAAAAASEVEADGASTMTTTCLNDTTEANNQPSLSSSSQHRPPPWYHRHPDAESEMSDDSHHHLYMSEPSVTSEADSSEYYYHNSGNLLLGREMLLGEHSDGEDFEDHHRSDGRGDGGNDSSEPGLPPQPHPPLPPHSQQHQQHQQQQQQQNTLPPHYQQYNPIQQTVAAARPSNPNNNYYHQYNQNAYMYNHYYHQFNPQSATNVPAYAYGTGALSQPTSPGNTSLSSWDSPHENSTSGLSRRRVLIHVSPSTYGRSSGGDESDTSASGAAIAVIGGTGTRLPTLPTSQELLEQSAIARVNSTNSGGSGSSRRGDQPPQPLPQQPLLQPRNQRRSPTPPPYPPTATTSNAEAASGSTSAAGGGETRTTTFVFDGAKTPDRTPNNSHHSNSTSPASEGQLQQLENFLDDLRIQSEGRVREHHPSTTSSSALASGQNIHHGSEYSGMNGNGSSDNISFESSVYDGPRADVKDVLRRKPSSSSSSQSPHVVKYTKRPPTPPLLYATSGKNSNTIPSTWQTAQQQQQQEQQQEPSSSNADAKIISGNASGSFGSSLDLPLSEVGGVLDGNECVNDDRISGKGGSQQEEQQQEEQTGGHSVVLDFSDSDDDNKSETTPVERILSKATDLGVEDKIGMEVATETLDRIPKDSANPNRQSSQEQSQQKYQTSDSSSKRSTGDNITSNRNREARNKNTEKAGEHPRRHHRRQRSGDAAAAKIATGSKEWRGMTADRIPVPIHEAPTGGRAGNARRKKDTIDRVEEWKTEDASTTKSDDRDNEISRFSSFALGSSLGSDTPIRNPRRTKQLSYRRMRQKNNHGDSDSSISTDYNQFFQPPIQINPNNNQHGLSSPTLSGYSVSPADSIQRKTYPSLSPAPGSFRSFDNSDDYDRDSTPPPPPPPPKGPNWDPVIMQVSPTFNQHPTRLSPYNSMRLDSHQNRLGAFDRSRQLSPMTGARNMMDVSSNSSPGAAPPLPYRSSSSPYPSYQLDGTSPFFASDSRLGQHHDVSFLNTSLPSMNFENSSPKSGDSPGLRVKTGQSTSEALKVSQNQEGIQGPEHEEETSFQFSDGSSGGDSIDQERNIHRFHDAHYDHRVVRHHHGPDLSANVGVTSNPYGVFGNSQRKKVDRSQFLPKTTADNESESGFPTYTCPICNTRQRRFFTVSSAPRQFASAGGYIAFYFAIYVIASLYIFGLQEGWSKLDCIYFAVITLTTAGLGDFVPTTDGAKIICSIFIYFGVACIGLLLGSYIAGMMDDRSHKEALENQVKACPNCARIQNIRDASERRRRGVSPNPELGRNLMNNVDMAKAHAMTVHASSEMPHEPASKKVRRSDIEQFSMSERSDDHPSVSFWTPQSTSRKSAVGFAPHHLSPGTEANLLGSPMTSQILARQLHSRHVSIDLGNASGISLDNIPQIPSLNSVANATGHSRNYSFDVPTTVQEGVQSPDGDTRPPPPPPPPQPSSVDPSACTSSNDLFSEDGDSDSESSYGIDDEELEEHNSGVKNAKYVFLTLREALMNSLVIIAFGCLGFYLVEGFSFIDAWYFTTVLLTTVGYGDLTPYTQGGKLFATVYLLVAGTILLHNMSTISMIPLELRRRRTEQAVLTQFGDSLDDDALRELATGPYAQRLNLASRDSRGLEQCTRETFSLVMLIRLGKVTEEDIKLTFAAFRRLDVNNEGVLDSKSIIGGMIQKRRKTMSQLNLAAMDKPSNNGRSNHSSTTHRHDSPLNSTASRGFPQGTSAQPPPTYSSMANAWAPYIGSWMPGMKTVGGGDVPVNNSSTTNGESFGIGMDYAGPDLPLNMETSPLIFNAPSYTARTHSHQNYSGRGNENGTNE